MAEHRGEDRKQRWETLGGIDVPRCADDAWAAAQGYDPDAQAAPGDAPYTRGIHSSMYRERLWTMRQYAGFSSAAETNERFRVLLTRGQKGLSIAFDLPTQLGMDSDEQMSEGEVGRVGVAIDTVEDMHELLSEIPLDQVSTSMTINAPAMLLLAMYIVVAEETGIDSKALQGTTQNDILKEYIARGTHIFPPAPSLRLITDTFEFCREELPLWNTISVSGYHIREAGSTAVQEVAFTLANALQYIDAALAAGLDIDAFAPRMSFFFNCHNDFFEEASKFRAARSLWHQLMQERYSPDDPRSSILRFHTQVAGVSLTAQQAQNNIARVTIQALAAVCGGTQSLHTNAFDEAIGLPTEHSATIALRTQQIIAEESGAADVVDPLGGSYLVEGLTARIIADARAEIERIDAMGGALSAIEMGYQQRAIHDAAFQHQQDVESGHRKIVGVNTALSGEQPTAAAQTVDPNIRQMQQTKLDSLRSARDEAACLAALEQISLAAAGTDNLFPPIIEAVRRRCTLGEMTGVLSEVFGDYQAPTGF